VKLGFKIFTFLIFCLSSVALADDFRTIDGKEYKNVTVRRVEPDGIVLVTRSGIWKIYFNELPEEVQKRFHYDAAKATAYSNQQAATQEAFRQQQEELQRRRTEELQKTQQPKLQVAAVSAPNRGQPVEVITHGAQIDITKHLALGNVTIVDFYADWCGPCRRVSPTLEQMAQTDPEIALRKVDIVHWNTAVANQYNIRSIPHVKVFNRQGSLVGTVVGVNVEEVKRYVAQAKAGG
jgi:thiol-disulfide isomerase/thioredoxin